MEVLYEERDPALLILASVDHYDAFSTFMDSTTLIGLLAACLTTGALLPQVLKTCRTRSTHDLSLGMFSMLFFGTLLWCVYGLIRQDVPIVFANGLAALFSAPVLWLKLHSMTGAAKKSAV